jgi:hypothetical protein
MHLFEASASIFHTAIVPTVAAILTIEGACLAGDNIKYHFNKNQCDVEDQQTYRQILAIL